MVILLDVLIRRSIMVTVAALDENVFDYVFAIYAFAVFIGTFAFRREALESERNGHE